MRIPTDWEGNDSGATNLIAPDVLVQHRNLQPPHVRLLEIDGELQNGKKLKKSEAESTVKIPQKV
ncbi:MAG TPA: hypothetical protein VEJ47_09325 [Candidatus Eremiobacteraceae bacterium]|nr:hypothetical protein [Candidatus Eremiobacteraceae bacterium]